MASSGLATVIPIGTSKVVLESPTVVMTDSTGAAARNGVRAPLSVFGLALVMIGALAMTGALATGALATSDPVTIPDAGVLCFFWFVASRQRQLTLNAVVATNKPKRTKREARQVRGM